MTIDYDVIIIGGGIAGGFLARHLVLERGPGIRVLVLEASDLSGDDARERFKVGESTVELAAHYMIRRLKLGPYLYQHHLPKNGLRFFFDSPESDTPLAQMSEIGSDHMPFHPSFQLERARLEIDLWKMNVEAGVDFRLGAKVVDVRIDRDGGHEVTFETGGDKQVVRGRWVVDASGRRHVLNRKLGLPVHKDTRLNTAAAWGRYRGTKSLDECGDDAWRRRVRFTSRYLSTNHFMYDGYWIWFIPLSGDLMSVGLVYDRDRFAARDLAPPQGAESFEAFIRSHAGPRELLADAERQDYMSYAHLPYYSDRYFSADRWALTGEAGAFTDPFYSPGSDFIATANEIIAHLVFSDLDGQSEKLQESVDLFNEYYKFRYESVLRLYRRQYETFGCFEAFRLKYLLDFNNYYNLVTWPFMAGKTTDPEWLRTEVRLSSVILLALDTMAQHFSSLVSALASRGEYHRHNQGKWQNGLAGVYQLQPVLGTELDVQLRRAEADRVFGSVLASIIERMTGKSGLAARDRVVDALDFPTVCRFDKIDDASVEKLMSRIGLRLTKQIRSELPGASDLSVELGPDGVHVRGPTPGETSPDATISDTALVLARRLWDERGRSLTQEVV